MPAIRIGRGFVTLNNMRVPRVPAALCLASLAFAYPMFAHPMGNLSVNHYARLEPGSTGIDITYVLDLAEIPTFELTQSWNVPRDADSVVLKAKAEVQARAWVANLAFTEDGKPLAPKIGKIELTVLEGAGNLPVFRIATQLHLAARGGRFEYEDRNYPTRAGWREIVIRPEAGADVSKASSGASDISQALTAYPQDPTRAPPQDTRAWFDWTIAAGPVSQMRKPVIEAATPRVTVPARAAAPSVTTPSTTPVTTGARPPETSSMGTVKRNDAISRILRMKDISWPLLATLIGLSFWFGALHALEPGHGKTMVAAYLVGARGTPKHAALLGGMVTFTHTISVFILGLATLFLSRYIMPDKISKVLGIVSGLSIVWIGECCCIGGPEASALRMHIHTITTGMSIRIRMSTSMLTLTPRTDIHTITRIHTITPTRTNPFPRTHTATNILTFMILDMLMATIRTKMSTITIRPHARTHSSALTWSRTSSPS